MSGRNAYAAGVGAFPVDIWDAWYGPYSGAPGPQPNTLAGNNLTIGTQIMTMDPYWGQSEFVLMQYQTASTLVATGTWVIWDQNYVITVGTASLANSARSVGFVGSNFLSDATVGTLSAASGSWNNTAQTNNQLYGWVQIAGLTPALSTATAAAGPAFTSATAGAITSTAAAGQQFLNTRILIATGGAWSRYGATTLLANTISGRSELFLNDKTGLFVGMQLAGTNIPANTTILDMQTGRNNSVLLSANATATGATTVTPSYNNGTIYTCLVQTDRPFQQGQIT